MSHRGTGNRIGCERKQASGSRDHDCSSSEIEDERRPLLQEDVEAKVTVTPLPRTQLVVLCLLRLLDPLAFTQIFPYINNFLQDLHLTDDPSRIGFYSGLVESAFAVFQLLAIYPWAWTSDLVGRRPVILVCVTGLAITTLLFGLSTTFRDVMISRSLAGLFTGNVAVIPSVLCEITDTSNQATAFPIFGLFWPIGAIVGPLIGGSLSNPAKRYPKWFSHELWRTYPYFLPCLIATIVTVIVALISYAFLQESLDTSTPTMDREAVNGGYGSAIDAPTSALHLREKPSIRRLLQDRTIQRLCMSGCAMNFITTAFEVVFVLFCYTPMQSGGLGFSESQIGYSLSISGILAASLQLFVMPTLLRRYDHARMYIFLMGLWPFAFAALPLLNIAARLVKTKNTGELAPDGSVLVWIGIVMILSAARTGYLAHSLIILLIKRYAPPSALASTNGLVQFGLCFARAFSPAFVSSMFAVSTENNLLGGHLWVLVMVIISVGGCMVSRTIISSGRTAV